MSEEEIDIEETEARLEEIAARYEEKGFFRRIGDMMAGLKYPKSSREYKLARIELQRLAAPIIAIIAPILGGIVLIVITAIQSEPERQVKIEVARATEEDPKEVEDEEPPPPEDPPEPEPLDEIVDVVDNPTPGPVSDMTPMPSPPSKQVSVKPATQDTVAFVQSPVKMRSMVGSRTPGSIGARTGGGANNGDQFTEAAVLKALRWLKKTQQTDGSWSPSPVSNTGLAVLAFLAHGETPDESQEFGGTVQRAVQFLIDQQYVEPDGTAKFRNVDGNEYAFLIATYALCEAYGMTKNPSAKAAAETALYRIVAGQSSTGGWDYKINKNSTRDDMSFAGWALQALKAGKMAGLHPEGLTECIAKAINYLKKRAFKNGGFGYCAGNNPGGLTGTGCLALQLLGFGQEPEALAALEYMRGWTPQYKSTGIQGDTPGSNPQYYCYYAAQCKYQAGMRPGASPVDLKSWQTWNQQMKALYPKTIITLPETIQGPDGKEHAMGYWKYADPTCQGGGDTMGTCLCALQLMVYYRYLPTTQAAGGSDDVKTQSKASKAAKKKSAEVKVSIDI